MSIRESFHAHRAALGGSQGSPPPPPSGGIVAHIQARNAETGRAVILTEPTLALAYDVLRSCIERIGATPGSWARILVADSGFEVPINPAVTEGLVVRWECGPAGQWASTWPPPIPSPSASRR